MYYIKEHILDEISYVMHCMRTEMNIINSTELNMHVYDIALQLVLQENPVACSSLDELIFACFEEWIYNETKEFQLGDK